MRKFLLLVCLIFNVWNLNVCFASNEDIRISKFVQTNSNDLISVKGAFRKDCPQRMQLALRVEKDLPANQATVKAYYYDGQGKLLLTADKPSPIWTQTAKGFESIGLPDVLKPGKDIVVYFPITPELKAQKWRSMVIVFSDGTTTLARSFPGNAIETLDFPEKAAAAAASATPH